MVRLSTNCHTQCFLGNSIFMYALLIVYGVLTRTGKLIGARFEPVAKNVRAIFVFMAESSQLTSHKKQINKTFRQICL